MPHPQSTNYFVMTMETASLSTLSPNTSMLSVGLTSRAWNIARVATGSTADIRAPKEKLKKGKKQQQQKTSYMLTHTHTHIKTYPTTHLLILNTHTLLTVKQHTKRSGYKSK